MIEKRELLKILDAHNPICWDLDKTVIKGKNSPFFQRYICSHPEKTHHIVTFRTGQELDEIFDDIRNDFPRYDGTQFESIVSIPEEIDKAFYSFHHKARELAIFPKITDTTFKRKFPTLNREEVITASKNYCSWKPKTCLDLGSSILIDDVYNQLKNDCKHLGVELINSIQYIQSENTLKQVIQP